ncbi:efflux RND transporter periplasmic adaptor subunit [Phenylobacterium aquaticum]|uniref:efflux RND transporter periplasmic adaptor subunit n=3 Tax=Phenylobacterium aquaticum TaxID=1763816 RepID=UPI0026EF22C0|nr:efflux RND transporter periplasmic adaptor subunit [Phenylobacterium aquaticum]
MRLKSSYVVAIGIVLFVALLFAVGSLSGGKASKADPKATAAATKAAGPPSVQVQITPETLHAYTITIRGRTEAARSVVVRSETAGTVAAVPSVEGSFVRKGAILCKLNVDARQAAADQARAQVRAQLLTQQASVELARKGYRSQTQVLQAQAALDNAQAVQRQAEVALEQMNIRAPFDGVFDKRDAEIGAYLSPGQSCGTMIELDPILIVGDLPETETGRLRVGAAGSALLLSGETLTGHVRYLSREADAQTRTYHIEVTARNPGLKIRSGLSATVKIEAGQGPAHMVPVSALVLDAAGRQGVRFVQPDNVVAFAPVTVIEETPRGVWVSGLHGQVQVITVGQSYVAEGQKVRIGASH